jgi:hypothetical protein
MGHTRVIYTDATTAEAASVLKGSGFLEGSKGGLFTSQSSGDRVYVVWGKSAYYPEILQQLEFAPRIQIHLKCSEGGRELEELTLGTASGLVNLSPGTRLRIFNADSAQEIQP